MYPFFILMVIRLFNSPFNLEIKILQCSALKNLSSYQSTPHSPLPTPHSPFPIPHSPFTIHHSPFTIHHSLFTTHRSPLTIHHSPFTTHQKKPGLEPGFFFFTAGAPLEQSFCCSSECCRSPFVRAAGGFYRVRPCFLPTDHIAL